MYGVYRGIGMTVRNITILYKLFSLVQVMYMIVIYGFSHNVILLFGRM